jgi:PAS domain S-box-containing protein
MFINNFAYIFPGTATISMKTHDAELKLITDLLRDNPKGLKITRIAQKLGMNRNAAAKYLEILLMTGQVEVLEHGMSKIFILSRRTGIPTMLDGSSDMILVIDSLMNVSRVNDNYLKFAGMKQENLLGKRVDGCGLPILMNPLVLDKIHRARFGEDVRTEVKEAGRDGREYFFDIRLTPAVFNDGRRGITIIIGDVTQEKKMRETAADEGRKLVEGILSCIDDAVVLLDSRSGAISFLNPAAQTMFGYGPDEYTGREAGFLAGKTGAIPVWGQNLADAFHRQGHYKTESRMKRNNGTEFSASLQLRPIYDSSGGLRNLVMIVRDLPVGTGTGLAVAHDTREPVMPLPPGIFSSAAGRNNTAI